MSKFSNSELLYKNIPTVGAPLSSPSYKYSDSNPDNVELKNRTEDNKNKSNAKVVKNAGRVRHTQHKEKMHERAAQKNGRPRYTSRRNKELNSRPIKEQRAKSPMTGNKNVIKPVTASAKLPPNTSSMWSKIKAQKTWGKMAVGFGAALTFSYILNKVILNSSPVQLSNSNPVSYDPRASAYIPERMSRGYDTIKQSFTPFGSPISLSKTRSVINSFKSSIRKNTVRTTRSITKTALPFTLNDRAISHTRY